MKTDLVIVWPDNLDFPLWRKWLFKNENLFENIIIYFNPQNRDWNLLPFLASDRVFPYKSILLKGETKPGDWRNNAVNECLKYVKSEWVWFTEQDFFVDKGFFHTIYRGMEKADAIGFKENNRFHPACLFVKKSLIDKTTKDFSAKPPQYDHFGKFSQEIHDLGKVETLKRLKLEKDFDFFHHAGLSDNYGLVQLNKPPNANLQEFLVYNASAREVDIKQSEQFIELTHKAEYFLAKIKRFL